VRNISAVTERKTLYMPMELIFKKKKKGICLPHMSSIFKKSVLKLLYCTLYSKV
jgi:hypothetical protein